MARERRLTIRVSDDEYRMLQLVARIEDTTMTELLTDSVDKMIADFRRDPAWQDRRIAVREADAALYERLTKLP